MSASELQQQPARWQRARTSVIAASSTTWALTGALAAVAIAEAIAAWSNNVSGSIATGLVLEGLVVACVLAARGTTGGRALPPLAAALLVLTFVPLERLASFALPAHLLPRSTWPAAVAVILLVCAWRIAPIAGQGSMLARLKRPVLGDAVIIAGAVPVGLLWFGMIHHADATLPHGAPAIAGAVVLVAFAALAEELVFRGVLLDALARARITGSRTSARAEAAGANVMASLAYAAACLGWPMPYPILAFVVAMVLGRTALHRRSVSGVAIAHFVAWAVAIFIAPAIFGASASGFIL